MAASVSSLGPPSVGPGNSAAWGRQAPTARAVNKEPLSGNTLCHKNNIERKHAIHESRLASVKASLSLSTPRRMEFMDKRLSKNFHMRRHHKQVVHENLKLLRALEEIHSRSSTTAAAGTESLTGGGGGSLTTTGGQRGRNVLTSKSASNTTGSSVSRKKLSSLLARKRNVKAAIVARENQKMMERMTRSKSLYSRDKMREHRVRHQRVMRLRKTDYTAGHLLAAATAKRHWRGGDSRDEGFAYSFEEGRQSHRNRHRRAQANQHHGSNGGVGHANSSMSPSTGTSRSVRRSSTAARGASYSPARSVNSRSSSHKGVGGGRGTRSAPRLPSLSDVDDIYGVKSFLGSPNLEQCLAAGVSARSGGGGGGGSGSRASSSRNSALGPGNHDEEGSRRRPSTSGSGSRGGSRQHRKSSPRQRGGKDMFGGGSTGGQRGTDQSVDSLSHSGGSVLGFGEDFPGVGKGGRYSSRRNKGAGGGRGDKDTGSLESGDVGGNDADLDKIFNPLAFLDETQGVRVLIQATKPLEVLNHVGETWICFIRIMVKDPFDDQLDIRVIHDREEVCRRVLSMEEANAICEHAQKISGGHAVRIRPPSFVPLLSESPTPSRDASIGPDATAMTERRPSLPNVASDGDRGGGSAEGEETAEGEGRRGEPDPHGSSAGLKRYSASDGDLNELLSTLFKKADTENKGFLTPEQLISIMQDAELGLTGPELHLVIAEADDNADGSIDYYEFIPLAYNLVNAFRARRRACEQIDEANFDLDEQAIHALYDAEFDRLVRQLKVLCSSLDPNGTGVLPRADFKQCISADRCGGLTKIESKLLLNLLPKDSHGNVIYRKLGACLEQVRFTTLRNTVAEASATDTQKYLMTLCREEDAKSDPPGKKGHKTAGDVIAIGGKHYSGELRARQLAKILLNAPLLSLSRLHVTALMSQAHCVDGMVNYVELVPMIAKTIEGMFHPRSLRMRHEIFKSRGSGGSAGSGGAAGVAAAGGPAVGGPASGAGGATGVSGGGAGGTGEGASSQQPQATGAAMLTVQGKSRDDVQRIFVDVLREDTQGVDIDRLKDPATFARCMASLGLDLEPDTISALWVAADLDSRQGTTFVDVVDFCFNCVLFMEREKEVKSMQRSRNSPTRASQGGRGPGAAAVARAEAVAAAALAAEEAPVGKTANPLLSLARTLVRHAKVTSPTEGKVGLEFPLDRSPRKSEDDGGVIPSDPASPASNEAEMPPLFMADSDGGGADNIGDGGHGTMAMGGAAGTTAGLQLLSEAAGAKILLRARRRMPVVGSSGQPVMVVSSLPAPSPTGAGAVAAEETARGPSRQSGGPQNPTQEQDGAPHQQQQANNKTEVRSHEPSRNSSLEVPEGARTETQDMALHVYWDGAARDRAYVEVFPAGKKEQNRGAGEAGQGQQILRLAVRVPTLAIVDAKAASKFAERVVQQMAIQIDEEKAGGGGGRKEERAGQPQQRGHRLLLAGVDEKSVVSSN